MAEISFLLPVHNGGQFLRQTLDSLLSQDFSDYDIHIIDDGSTDDSAQIIDDLNSDKIHYNAQQNAGLVAALNNGLSRLDCKYVARIDADDICYPNRLSRQLDYLQFTQADVVSCKAVHIDELGHPLGISGVSNVYDPDPDWLPPKEPYLSHPFMFGRLEVLAQTGYRDAHLSEDADLCWRLSETHRLAVQNAILGEYRLHLNSISTMDVTAGRVQAFYAALAALNAKRRAQNRVECAYDKSLAQSKQAATDMDGLVALFTDHLDAREQTYLHAAACMKLLHLARWRGYAITMDDVMAAKRAVKRVKPLSTEIAQDTAQIIAEAELKLSENETPQRFSSRLAKIWSR
ncbi:hypothetical protein GCM10008927_23820 [Amylibacter ulvae]|uniref:Glycosyltransferase 2-like domain-containing protein n=1 Tax=Paramylibacter ulvae TaxID=1651968 RepID=A0ABQ3D6M6_9RHOB|nr:glycosyltransferase family 2 protein [Amylibacter ulvae]GHA57387.1 hypothetical protein GCM10008927_23820 [Amylibacter ulvae]